MKLSQYGRISLIDIRTRYKSYIKQIIDYLNDTLGVFELKQIDLVKIKNNLSEKSSLEEFNKVWSPIGKLTLQRRAFLNMIHVNLFTYFEAFNKDFFLEVFLSNPKSLLKNSEAKKKGESDKILDYREILDFSTYEEIIFHMSYKQVEKYAYLNIDRFNRELKSKFDIDLSINFKNWDELRENYYRRNVVVHNKSRISKIYAFKMNCEDEIEHGLRSNPNYIKSVGNNIDKYIDFIYDKITAKFKLS